ncbi:MAG: hypothetical protein AUH09_09095 [Candidatus Rokubacteria bacterium 13_2_20CM_70_12]|nr:MAG: hypothetical protein AUH09_09095 [Candidatus Rokubacteria bacterium 13_2_20CM_70_12]
MRISLAGLTKRFGASTAVDGLSLEIGRGELVSLVGGSGCGKTTTLRLIAGFERPDAGEVRFDDRVVNDVAPRRRSVGIVFQSYALFPTMTVAENIAFGLRVARWPAVRIYERVAEMVALTRLGGLEGRYANQLSALDAKIRLRLRGEIRRIQQDLGITTLYVTHDQEEALSIADRIAVMRNGRIEQVGRPEEIYARPRTDFVADFIGISNLLACRVVSAREGLVDWEGERLRIAPDVGRDGEGILLALRPEKLAVVAERAPEDGRNRLQGVLEVVTFLGPFVRLEVTVHGRPLWVDAPHATGVGLERKKSVTLAFAPDDGVVIAATGSSAD